MRISWITVTMLIFAACASSQQTDEKSEAAKWNQERPGQWNPESEARRAAKVLIPSPTATPSLDQMAKGTTEGLNLSNIGDDPVQGDFDIKTGDGTIIKVRRQTLYLSGKNDHDLLSAPFLEYTIKNGDAYDLYAVTLEIQASIGNASVFERITENQIPKYKERRFNFLLNEAYDNKGKGIKTEAKVSQVLIELNGEIVDVTDAYRIEWR